MVITMTREEYERKYGVKPPVQQVQQPIMMTRAEYEAKYKQPVESAPVSNVPFPASPTDSPLVAGLRATGNLPKSAFNFGKGIYDAVANPIDTGKGLFSVAKGGVQKLIPGQQGDEEAFNAFTGFLKERYGSLEGLQKTATEDPFGFGTDVLGVITGGAGVLGKAGAVKRAIPKVASPITTTTARTASAVSDKVGKTARFGVSQATGLNPETITELIRNPDKFKNISPEIRTETANVVKDALDERLRELSELGKGYDAIRTSGAAVPVPTGAIQKILDKHRIKYVDGKILTTAESTPLSAADKTELAEFLNTFGNEPIMSGNSMLNARAELSRISKYDKGKTGNLERIGRDMRGVYDSAAKESLPGLLELDAEYAPEVTLLNKLKKDIFDSKTGELKDGAISKIANITGKGKEKVLERVKQIVPDIEERVNLLKAAEDIERSSGIKVGSYTRSALQLGGVVGGAITMNPALIIGAIISQPQVAVPLLKGAGYVGQKVLPIAKALRDMANDVNNFTIPPQLLNSEGQVKMGLSLEDVSKKPGFTPKQVAVYNGEKVLTTKLLQKLKGRSTVSKQFISDLTNQPDLKQAERDLIRNSLADEADVIDVPKFANKVKSELLPLKAQKPVSNRVEGNSGFTTARYENITLPDELRGPVASYGERIYQSPIKTSAGDVHFSGMEGRDNYFAHTRIEDLPNSAVLKSKALGEPLGDVSASGGTTRRVIEIQSDLFQKGRLEDEIRVKREETGLKYKDEFRQEMRDRADKLSKLEPYRNTWHERIIREEVKQAAKDGKTKLQFPTGETAMKIEGLGETQTWKLPGGPLSNWAGMTPIKENMLKVGLEIQQFPAPNSRWIITDVLGDGKFKAVPKRNAVTLEKGAGEYYLIKNPDGSTERAIKGKEAAEEWAKGFMESRTESFDISGKIDTNNPIYKFYEKEVGRYLTNKYGAKRIKDAQGVEWYEIDLKGKGFEKAPVEAFGAVAGGTIASDD